MVPYTHGKLLHELCGKAKNQTAGKASGGAECSFLLSQTMTHNEFDTEKDYFEPVSNFLQTNNIDLAVGNGASSAGLAYSVGQGTEAGNEPQARLNEQLFKKVMLLKSRFNEYV